MELASSVLSDFAPKSLSVIVVRSFVSSFWLSQSIGMGSGHRVGRACPVGPAGPWGPQGSLGPTTLVGRWTNLGWQGEERLAINSRQSVHCDEQTPLRVLLSLGRAEILTWFDHVEQLMMHFNSIDMDHG